MTTELPNPGTPPNSRYHLQLRLIPPVWTVWCNLGYKVKHRAQPVMIVAWSAAEARGIAMRKGFKTLAAVLLMLLMVSGCVPSPSYEQYKQYCTAHGGSLTAHITYLACEIPDSLLFEVPTPHTLFPCTGDSTHGC